MDVPVARTSAAVKAKESHCIKVACWVIFMKHILRFGLVLGQFAILKIFEIMLKYVTCEGSF